MTPATHAPEKTTRYALIGSPNSGKTTLFNSLTGLRAKTGNYPGVTVARYEGAAATERGPVRVEDLPGVYGLGAISPDERIVEELLTVEQTELARPDALIVTLDMTTLRRSVTLLAELLATGLPVCVVLTFGDEMASRGGSLDIDAFRTAVGVPVLDIPAGSSQGVERLRELLADPSAWPQPVVPPPTSEAEAAAWAQSVLRRASYRAPDADRGTHRIDAVLLHPLWGTLVFFTAMFALFQLLFAGAAPIMELIEGWFGALGERSAEHLDGLLGRFVSEALIGGVGGVLVFLPQIALLFLMVSLMEGSGYMARAAFLMDRVFGRFGLEGRSFVAMLSSLACAIPGIMATRTLPSARDRIATMMGAPLMTCSARIPVYVMLIAMLVPDERVGVFGLQGLTMFALYLLGAVSAMLTAALFARIAGRGQRMLPFAMEMPPYRVPRWRTVALSVWESCKAFLKKVTSIILVTTALLWGALNLPLQGEDALSAAGVDPGDDVAVVQYTLDNSYAASVGKAVEPVFQPLGFDWRINVGVIASLAAREVFVATMGQLAAAEDPEDPQAALEGLTVSEGPRAGQPLFDAPTTIALMVFFMFALQCFATIGVMRRETGGWTWPAVAFGYMFVLAWGAAAIAHAVVSAAV